MKPFLYSMWIVMFLAACDPPTNQTTQPAATSIPFNPTVTWTIQPTHTAIPIHLPPLPTLPSIPQTTLSPPQATETAFISSPLQGISISELPHIVSNPYEQPQIGKDDAHHGTDFAFYKFNAFDNIAGLPIQSVFSGKISAVTEDLPPYGNMIIIESTLPKKILAEMASEKIAIPSADWNISPQLTCPSLPPPPPNLSDQDFSLYVLYAHLAQAPSLQIGEAIFAGDVIGRVGNSGMSGNPHLHLEFRIGPSGYGFEPMGHYRGDLSESEIENYCIWRVSGWFIPFDPMNFLNPLNSSAN